MRQAYKIYYSVGSIKAFAIKWGEDTKEVVEIFKKNSNQPAIVDEVIPRGTGKLFAKTTTG